MMLSFVRRFILATLTVAILAMPYSNALANQGREAVPATEERTTLRTDGSTIHWQIDRRGRSGAQSILILAQGSGCLPTALNENISRFRALAPSHAVLTVEKYGVTYGSKVSLSSEAARAADCSEAYVKGHTVSQRVDDYERVLGALKGEGWWNGRVVLFGGSEGGAAMAVLAPRLSGLDAVIIMSTGTGLPMAEWIKDVLPPPVAAQADGVFARIRENPQSAEVWGGNSFKWWADILDRVLADDLLKVSAPILLIHGELDQFGPVRSARATRDRFVSAGRGNLTYWERKGQDHFMVDREGRNRLGDVLTDANAWLRSQRTSGNP